MDYQFRPLSWRKDGVRRGVSILVLMDYQFRLLTFYTIQHTDLRQMKVSILVLMDYQFRHHRNSPYLNRVSGFHPCFNGLSI